MIFLRKLKFLPFYIASYLPFTVLYFLSDIAFILLYYILKYRREVVYKNLRNAFPEKKPIELNEIERGFYKHFSDLVFETIKGISMSEKEYKKRIIFKNIDLIHACFENRRSIILYAGHFGNWEWISILPLSVPHQVTSFYQPLSNKYFDQLTKITRERFGAICIESNKGFKTIIGFELKNMLTLNLIIGDQSPRKKSSKHWTRFLNQETAFLVGADKIAKKSNLVLFFPRFKKIKRGHYELEFKIITESPKKLNDGEIIEKYASLLEEAIRDSPELWLWSHRRWKLTA